MLDVGCGVGYGSYYLALHGAREILGIDCSRKAIRFAKRNYLSPNLSFEVLDALHLAERGKKFDAIVCFEVVEHIREIDRFLQSIYDILLDEGVFIISTPNKNKLKAQDNNPYHYYSFSPDEFRTLLESKFREVFLFGQIVKAPDACEEDRCGKREEKNDSIGLRFKKTILPVFYFLGILKHGYLKSSDFQFLSENFDNKAENLIALCSKK